MTNRIYSVLIVVLVALLVFGCGTSRRTKTKKRADKTEQIVQTIDTIKKIEPIEPLDPPEPVESKDETVQPEVVDGETPEVEVDMPEAEESIELLVPIDEVAIEGDSVVVETPLIPSDTVAQDPKLTKIPADTVTIKPKDAKEVADTVAIKPKKEQEKKPSVFDEPQRPEKKPSSSEPESKKIEFAADIMRPVNITDDSTALSLVGNVVLYHNGAVITCDSAVRYGENRMDCFKRVIINQGTTYVYGDKLVYNGEINEARVYAPIIKIVDKDAVLFTYKFTFNTKDKVGIYDGGGTMTQRENEMESQRGYYYVDTREVVGVDQVEVRNLEYSMKSDSVIYSLDTDVVSFFTKSYVWNDKKDILVADRGRYNNATADYIFTKNSYVLTEQQEVWADTMVYNSRTENATLYRDIQIRDEEQNTLAFGDYGEYWGEREEAMLTLDPALLSYDPQEPDTLYMRSDSMFLFSFPYDTTLYKRPSEMNLDATDTGSRGELVGGLQGGMEGEGEMLRGDSLAGAFDELGGLQMSSRDSMRMRTEGGDIGEGDEHTLADSTVRDAIDTLGVDSVAKIADDGKSIKQRQREAKAESWKLKAAERSAKIKAKTVAREAKLAAKLEANEAKKKLKQSARKNKRKGNKGDTTGELIEGEEVELGAVGEGDSLNDSLPNNTEDSLAMPGGEVGVTEGEAGGEELSEPQYNEKGELIAGGVAAPEEPVDPDKKQRMVRAHRNVKVFSANLQAVCDSLVGFSKDSTMHLYIEPIMWSDNNQITSEVMDIFFKNEELYKVEFTGGDPFMSSEVDTTRYNQIKGKYMEAWFRNNDIIKHDVIGNGQMYYYMQDDETQDLLYFMVMECADMTFLIENRQMERISWKGSPVYTIYPMDKIAEDQEQFLPDFVWHDDLRPKSKEDILTRVIKPSKREEMQKLDEPLFPLTQSIIADRNRMIEQGLWRDRNDELSPQAQEFILSLKQE